MQLRLYDTLKNVSVLNCAKSLVFDNLACLLTTTLSVLTTGINLILDMTHLIIFYTNLKLLKC